MKCQKCQELYGLGFQKEPANIAKWLLIYEDKETKEEQEAYLCDAHEVDVREDESHKFINLIPMTPARERRLLQS